MNPGFDKLQPYPFEKLAQLQSRITPADKPLVDLSIGEPKHPTPEFILHVIRENLQTAGKYPTIKGIPELREAIRNWLVHRFSLPADSLDADKHILPVNGTREALFAIAQCIIDPELDNPTVITGNPFYQIYEGAAFFAGASPWYVNCVEANRFLPDFAAVPETIWQQCQLLYLCSPNNPSGNVIDIETYKTLLDLSEQYNFVIVSDECYSEIYLNESNPPTGLLEAAAKHGNETYQRCLVFHSLSKRSNSPGLRSGFVAGDANIIENFYRYRTYHGCAMPLYTQHASIVAWRDEDHVKQNREQYRQKFDAVLDILQPIMNVQKPDASFYLWPETPISDIDFTRLLLEQYNVRVLPGSYMSRDNDGINPGFKRVRMALVATLEQCVEGAERIKSLVNSL